MSRRQRKRRKQRPKSHANAVKKRVSRDEITIPRRIARDARPYIFGHEDDAG